MGRPAPRFHDFIGHKELLDPVLRELAGAIARGEPAPHMLLTGPSGVGKTKLAGAFAAERGTRLFRVMGHIARDDLIRKLRKLNDCDFLFIDEAHNMKQTEQELLYEAIDRRCIPRVKKKPGAKNKTGQTAPEKPKRVRIRPFTLIVATDRPGELLTPLRKRLPTTLYIPPYDVEEMREIVATIAANHKVLLTAQAARKVAEVCHGLPRKAEHYLDKLRYFFPTDGEQIGVPQVEEFLNASRIDANGFGPTERRYLDILARHRSASLETLALNLNTDKDDVLRQIEAPLVQKGLVKITSAGRKLTLSGKELVKLQKAPSTRKENRAT